MAVYFIKDEATGFVKIGYSNNPQKRLKSLQTSSANKLTLIEAIEGNKKLEETLHTTFAEHRVRGEWFSLPSIDSAIRTAAHMAPRTSTTKVAQPQITSNGSELEAVKAHLADVTMTKNHLILQLKQEISEREKERSEWLGHIKMLQHQIEELSKNIPASKLILYLLKFRKDKCL